MSRCPFAEQLPSPAPTSIRCDEIPDRSSPRSTPRSRVGALADAGLTLADVDGYFCDATRRASAPISMAEYLGLKRRATSTPPRSAARPTSCTSATPPRRSRRASAASRWSRWPGSPRSGGRACRRRQDVPATRPRRRSRAVRRHRAGLYALAARRHMHEFGTTSEQLAEIKVAAVAARPAQPERAAAASRSRSRRCSTRRWSPTRCTGSTAA